MSIPECRIRQQQLPLLENPLRKLLRPELVQLVFGSSRRIAAIDDGWCGSGDTASWLLEPFYQRISVYQNFADLVEELRRPVLPPREVE